MIIASISFSFMGASSVNGRKQSYFMKIQRKFKIFIEIAYFFVYIVL